MIRLPPVQPLNCLIARDFVFEGSVSHSCHALQFEISVLLCSYFSLAHGYRRVFFELLWFNIISAPVFRFKAVSNQCELA